MFAVSVPRLVRATTSRSVDKQSLSCDMHTRGHNCATRRPRWIEVLSTSLQRAFAHTCVGDQAATKGCHVGQQSAYWTKESIMPSCMCERSALCVSSCMCCVSTKPTPGEEQAQRCHPRRRSESSKAWMTSPDLLSPRIRRHVRDGWCSIDEDIGKHQKQNAQNSSEPT